METEQKLPPVTHEQARESASRLVASHFRNFGQERARISIPANPRRDDDLLITRYIEEQAAKDRPAPVSTDGPLRPFSITIWRDGTWKVWPPLGGQYAQDESDYLVTIQSTSIQEELERAALTPGKES